MALCARCRKYLYIFIYARVYPSYKPYTTALFTLYRDRDVYYVAGHCYNHYYCQNFDWESHVAVQMIRFERTDTSASHHFSLCQYMSHTPEHTHTYRNSKFVTRIRKWHCSNSIRRSFTFFYLFCYLTFFISFIFIILFLKRILACCNKYVSY